MDSKPAKAKEQLAPVGKRSTRVKGPAPKKVGRPRNYALVPGLMRFSKARMYQRKALYKRIKHGERPALKKTRSPRFIKKDVGSGNAKGVRNVRVKKHPKIVHP
ncbi:unnamed protein product, partial [Notodromas monacha]